MLKRNQKKAKEEELAVKKQERENKRMALLQKSLDHLLKKRDAKDAELKKIVADIAEVRR